MRDFHLSQRRMLGTRSPLDLPQPSTAQDVRPAPALSGAPTAGRRGGVDLAEIFLFPVRALAMVFRAKHLEALDRAASSGELTLPDSLPQPGAFPAWLAALRQHGWVVYAKPPFAGPGQVLQYLGRYTHRVALSNERLGDLQAGVVRCRWKDYNDGNRVKLMALPAEEFIRRFLLHIVPERFVRIRHFGFLANRSRQAKLERCRQFLGQPLLPPSSTAEAVPALLLRLTGIDIERCQVCGQGRLASGAIFRPTRPIPVRAPDTS